MLHGTQTYVRIRLSGNISNLHIKIKEAVNRMFNSTMQIQPSDPPKNPIVAAILSFLLLGGVGQIYLGQQKKGIILIVVTVLLYCAFGLGVIINILGAIDAYMLADKLQKGQPIGDMEWFWEK